MRRWPWITIALAIIAALSPVGEEVFHGLRSGEQLSRTMSELILWIYGGIALALAVIECLIRWWLIRRRALRKPAGA